MNRERERERENRRKNHAKMARDKLAREGLANHEHLSTADARLDRGKRWGRTNTSTSRHRGLTGGQLVTSQKLSVQPVTVTYWVGGSPPPLRS